VLKAGGGCGCEVANAPGTAGLAPLAATALLLTRRRRRSIREKR
jgi:MYXO-CTERM domain-containing protein